MTELILKKRKPKSMEEVGLFLETEVFEEEWSHLPRDVDIKAECTVPANLKYLKFFWAMIGKVADNSPNGFLDKRDCADQVLLAARWAKMVWRTNDKAEIVPQSVAGLSADKWLRLLRRVTYVVITEFMPGMEENALKAEIEKMIGMDVFAKGGEPAKPSGPLPHSDAKIAPTVHAGPQNEAEYIASCRKWLAKQTDRFEALKYFDNETHKELRSRLKVSKGAFKMLEREIQMHFDEKEKV